MNASFVHSIYFAHNFIRFAVIKRQNSVGSSTKLILFFIVFGTYWAMTFNTLKGFFIIQSNEPYLILRYSRILHSISHVSDLC